MSSGRPPNGRRPEPIAITGIGCRFPGRVHDDLSYWDLVCRGGDAIVDVPEGRWSTRLFYHPSPAEPGKVYVQRAGFLHQPLDEFDAEFFGMSPREAARLDPQQRLLLEVTWEAMEDAGVTAEKLAGSMTGVFVGGFMMDHALTQAGPLNREQVGPHTASGSSLTMLAARLSYVLDLRGPALSIDTACSSSLVATHYACSSLRGGECDLAIVGGVNTMLNPDLAIALCKAGMLAPDGRSKAFAASADGYGRGEGAGVVLLRRLSTALAGGDPIRAVILGSAVNQDGHTATGISVPSQAAQEDVLRLACGRAGVRPEDVQYVEAHGTGTAVGDPIEARALGRALGRGRPPGRELLVGSVKANIGHLEAASGVAGLIKAGLCLQHGQIPGHRHAGDVNPDIPLAELRLRFPARLEAWPDRPAARLAGVSSFGFGGTNAHVILGEAPRAAPPPGTPAPAEPARLAPHLLVLSACGEDGLRAVAAALVAHLEAHGSPEAHDRLGDMAYSLARRRTHLTHRLALVASHTDEAILDLRSFLEGKTPPGLSTGRARRDVRPRLVWVFTGMGPQWWGMGRELLRGEPAFRSAFELCCEALRPHMDWSLREEFEGDEGRSRMGLGEVGQVSNFALQVGLAGLWRSWGVEPDAVVGHSVGEIAAAHAAGALSLEDSARLCAHRSRVLRELEGAGGLIAVGLGRDAAEELLAAVPGVEVAAVNSPHAVTLTGTGAALDALAVTLATLNVFHRRLPVGLPYHGRQIDPLRVRFLEGLAGLSPGNTTCTLYSTVTGRKAEGPELDAEHWWRNARNAVQLLAALEAAGADGADLFLEIGPHPVLAGAISECMATQGRRPTTLGSLHRDRPERRNVLATLGRLHALGSPVAWDRVYPRGLFVRLPKYPWQRSRHWGESERSREDRLGAPGHPLLGQRDPAPRPAWRAAISTATSPELTDHRVQGEVVFPGAGYLEIALAAERELHGAGPAALADVRFHRTLLLANGGTTRLHVSVSPRDGSFEIHGANGSPRSPWTLHASGRHADVTEGARPEPEDLEALRSQATVRRSGAEVYALLHRMGYAYGPAFRGISGFWASGGCALSEITVPESIRPDVGSYCFHPALLDACLHSMLVPSADGEGSSGLAFYLPVGIDRVTLWSGPRSRLWCRTRLSRREEQEVEGDAVVFHDDGAVVAEIRGLRARRFEERRPWHRDCEAYRQVWALAARPEEGATGPRCWLILADRGGLGEGLAADLRRTGRRAILAFRGSRYRRLDEDRHEVSPDGEADHARLVSWSGSDGPAPERVGMVFLWPLDRARRGGRDPLEPDGVADDCVGLAPLVRSVAKKAHVAPLWLVSRGAEPVRRTDRVAPAQALLWGFARTLFLEHPDLRVSAVDLDPHPGPDEACHLGRELRSARVEEEIALRGGERFVHRFEAFDTLAATGAAAPDESSSPLFRPDATYLIAGGLGGFGLATAVWMLEQGARHLALLGRRGAATQEAEEEVLRLRKAGADVRVEKADVVDPQQVASAVARIAATMPPLRGLVDAVADFSVKPGQDALLARASRDLVRRVMSAKVRGALHLHEQTRHLPLDFFVMFSSIAAVVGSVGAGPYVAANTFLDALAHFRRGLGLPALSVNWGAVADVGVLSRHDDLARHNDALGYVRLPARRLLAELGPLLRRQETQVGIGRIDWGAFARAHPVVATSARFERVRHLFGRELPPASSSAARPALGGLAPSERHRVVLERVRGIAARVLESAPGRLDVDAPLTETGLDSLGSVEIQAAVQAELGALVPLVVLLDGRSIRQVAELALSDLASGLAAREA